jgi:hypothetical protein
MFLFKDNSSPKIKKIFLNPAINKGHVINNWVVGRILPIFIFFKEEISIVFYSIFLITQV